MVVLAGLLFWRLSTGPVRLDFLASTLADALSKPDQGYVVSFSGLVLEANESLALTAEDARVAALDGTVLASSPEVRLGISRRALLRGVLAPSSLDLTGVRVRLYRTGDGSLRFTLAGSQVEPAPSGSENSEFDVSDFLRPPDPARSTGYLRRLRVTDGAVVLIDERSGTTWRAPGADFSIAREQEQITAGLGVTIDAPGGEQRLDASGGLHLETGEAWLEVRVGGLRLARLSPLVPALEQARAVDMAFDATASARFDGDGDLKQARFQAVGNDGTVMLDGTGVAPIPIRSAKIAGSLDAQKETVTIDDFMVMLGDAAFEANASIAFRGDRIHIDGTFPKLDIGTIAAVVPSAGDAVRGSGVLGGGFATTLSRDGNLDRLEVELKGTEGSIVVANGPIPLEELSVAATVEAEPAGFALRRLIADLGGPKIEASGRAAPGDPGWKIEGEVVARDVDVDSLDRFWPEGLASGGRRWVTENLANGRVSEARLALATNTAPEDAPNDADDADEISGSLAFEGVTARYWEPLPPFQEVSGAATFAGRTFDVRLDGGHLGNIELAEGRVLLTGLGLEAGKEIADVEVALAGPLAEILTVLDNPPLGYAKWLKIDPAQAGGNASARLSVRLPLLDDLTIDEVEIAASADLSGVTIPGVALERDLEDADLTLDVDKKKLELSGEGRLAGMQVTLNVTEVFEGEGSRIQLAGVLSEEVLARLEAPVGDYVAGPVPVRLTMTGGADGGRTIEADLDLAQAKLALAPVDWSKPAGTPGTVTLRLRLQGDRLVAVERFEVNAGTGYAVGRADLDEQGTGLRRLQLDRLRLGERTDIEATVEVAGDGTRTVHVAGASADLGPLLRQVDEPGSEGGDRAEEGDTLIDAKLRQVWIGAQYPLLNVDGHLMFDGATLRGGKARGEIGEGNTAHLVVGEADGERRLQLTLDDAGGALRTLGWVDSLTGGRLQINAARPLGPASAPWRGKVETGSFRVSGAPLAARLLAAASFTGLADLSSQDAGITFDRLEAPFELGEARLKLEPGRAYGGALGVTFFGSVDTEADSIDVAGTIVPAYALNRVLGSIPLLGTLLTGEEGSGLFAATYRASGPIDEPEISVNPLAALAPGFLRNLFGEIAGGGAGQEREPATDPAAERFPGNLN